MVATYFACGFLLLLPTATSFAFPSKPVLALNHVNGLGFSEKVNCAQKATRFQFGRGTKAFRGSDDINVVEGPFEGQFGLWFVNNHDAQEVLLYRLSLLASAIFISAGLSCAILLPPTAVQWVLDVCAVGFFSAFGVSLATIHIYMKPLHNMLKVFWAAGVVGSIAAWAYIPSHHLVISTFEHAELLLASGWVFVSLTGLFFKEFACFQRWEASALFALVPILTGGHFLQKLPPNIELALAEVLAVTFLFFALRKFGQSFKADIGDKSIFEFLARKEISE